MSISNADTAEGWTYLAKDRGENRAALTKFILCPNPKCNDFTLWIGLYAANYDRGDWHPSESIQAWRLIPWSDAKPLPEYVPRAVAEDYAEACAIRDLSPKAAATLARRSLQTMIRDFWSIQGLLTLNAEIKAIKDRVDPLTWKAIDAVRSMGNIGAHMEQDINLIVDVSPDEAQALIRLIEQLVADWYVARHEREAALDAIVALAAEKESQRQGPSP
jgi:hypothetical protein